MCYWFCVLSYVGRSYCDHVIRQCCGFVVCGTWNILGPSEDRQPIRFKRRCKNCIQHHVISNLQESLRGFSKRVFKIRKIEYLKLRRVRPYVWNNSSPTERGKKNSVALVRERTIPTERPPPVGEVSAQLLRIEGVTWSAQRIPTAVNLCFLDRSRYFLFK